MAKQLSVRIDDDLEEMMESEKEKLPYEITDSQIVRTALREYLEERVEGNPKTATATAD